MRGVSTCILLALFVLWTMVLSNCAKTEADMVSKQMTVADGGCCTYVSFEGIARIVRIAKTSASKSQAKVIGGPNYEGYEVWFRFVPSQNLPNDRYESLMAREHMLTLYNSWYFGPRYLKKYGIETDKTYPCVLKILREGTCSPLFFEIETIDRKDYFESRP